jgi:hypothetical protein
MNAPGRAVDPRPGAFRLTDDPDDPNHLILTRRATMSKIGNAIIREQEGPDYRPRCPDCEARERIAATGPTGVPGAEWATDREYRDRVERTTLSAAEYRRYTAGLNPNHDAREC